MSLRKIKRRFDRRQPTAWIFDMEAASLLDPEDYPSLRWQPIDHAVPPIPRRKR